MGKTTIGSLLSQRIVSEDLVIGNGFPFLGFNWLWEKE